jgi:hypothetical protein
MYHPGWREHEQLMTMRKLILALLILAGAAHAQSLIAIAGSRTVTTDTGVTFTPAAGAVSNPTTVTFSGAIAGSIYCSTQDGSTPATNLIGTACANGSLGATTSITTAVTVKAVSGKLGDMDSAVASAAYTISTASFVNYCTAEALDCSISSVAGSDLITVCANWSSSTGTTIASVSDGTSSFTLGTAANIPDGGSNAGYGQCAFLLAANSGTHTYTVTLSGAYDSPQIWVGEFSASSGTWHYDTANQAGGNSTSASSGSISTSGTAEVVISSHKLFAVVASLSASAIGSSTPTQTTYLTGAYSWNYYLLNTPVTSGAATATYSTSTYWTANAMAFSAYPTTTVKMIYDDDNTSDQDGVLATFPGLNKLMDNGEVSLVGMEADTANIYAAPGMKIMETYYNRTGLPSGAWQGSLGCSNGCNTSSWLSVFVAQYDSGDTRSNYADCVSDYRSKLASNTHLVIVESGILTCLNGLLTSPADGISSLTGVQLIKQSVDRFVIMGGYNPSGSEFNFASDPPDTANFFSTVTAQNGYPPIYEIGYDNGTSTNAGPANYSSATLYPSLWVANNTSTNQRPLWDVLVVLFGVRGFAFEGTTYFTDAGNGTQTVDATTGANSWSTSTASGHHYLANAASTAVLSNIFDGYSYAYGTGAMPPGNTVYIGNTAAGSQDGSSCVNEKGYAYFNTAGYWSGSPSGINVIQPGSSVVLCGTLTNALTVQASGTVPLPINIHGNAPSLAEVNLNSQTNIILGP